MAGIGGIIFKSAGNPKRDGESLIARLLEGLSFSDRQKRVSGKCGNMFWGAVAAIPEGNLDKASGSALGIDFVAEGSLYLSQADKTMLQNKYNMSNNLPDSGYIPYLFDSYGIDSIHRLSGYYNVFIMETGQSRAYLFNDRLGILPLFFYEDEAVFIFASKLEAILKTGLIPKPVFDEVSFAEHLLFHYIISDHTYIRGINTLYNAALLTMQSGHIRTVRYWSVCELIQTARQHELSDFNCLQAALQKAVDRAVPRGDKPYNFTLTGGWDSRLLLAYLLPHTKSRLRAYSFGAENSSDLLIPKQITEKEGLTYTPIVLNKDYLDKEFLPWAKQTVSLSGGSRNYKRTHYLFAAGKVSSESSVTLTGIFGDEVLKVGKPGSGEVIAPLMIDWISSDFDIEAITSDLSKQTWLAEIYGDSVSLTDELLQRMKERSHDYSGLSTLSEKYFAFRFTLNLRKYFGAEINSYNDYLSAEMPFLDYDFLRSYASTGYAGFRYPYRKSSLLCKRRTTMLYYRLTAGSYHALTGYDSSRGFSMQEAVSLMGNYHIIISKLLNKNKNKIDGFYTAPTDSIFYGLLQKTAKRHPVFRQPIKPGSIGNFVCNFNTLYYWTSEIASKYM